MAEFGLAAGVLQVAGFGAEVGSRIWKCAKDIRDAKRDLESIATEVEATARILESVGDLLSHPDTKALHTDQLLVDTEKVLSGCISVFNELDGPVQKSLGKLQERYSWQRASARLQWPLDKTRLTELRAMLERYRTVLHLMLTVLQIVETRQSKDTSGMDKLETQLKDVLLSNKHLSDSNKNLSDTIATLVRGTGTYNLADARSLSNSPLLLMNIAHTSATVTTSEARSRASGLDASITPGNDQEKAVRDQLQSCIAAVQGLAGSLSSAMNAWSEQTKQIDGNINGALQRVLEGVGLLPPQLRNCPGHSANYNSAFNGTCQCSFDALEIATAMFKPCDYAVMRSHGFGAIASRIPRTTNTLSNEPGPVLVPEPTDTQPPAPPESASPAGQQISESLNPSPDQSPQGNGQEWVGMGAYRGHLRSASDQLSDISSAHNSPYMQTLDSFDHTSPIIDPSTDPSLNDGIGLGRFTSNEPQHQTQTYYSPGHSPHISPRLMPQQGGLPTFTTGNNFGLVTAITSPNDGPELFPSYGQDSFTVYNQPTNPRDLDAADQMSPHEIQIDYAPPAKQSNMHPRPPRSIDDRESSNLPLRNHSCNQMRAKLDYHAGSRPSKPSFASREQPPALKCSPALYDSGKHTISPSSSPARCRSSSKASDHREYILDLANPERTPSNDVESRRQQKHSATFKCNLCPKRFTRAYNLRSHFRTHKDERPFVCTVCGKAFARQHDLKRHEGLHLNDKEFVCRGAVSGIGSFWGCGRRFARADALGRHFKSEAGRVCLKPLLDEEVASGRLLMSHDFLPAELLQQYPALASLDLGAAPQGPSSDEEASSRRSSFDASSDGEPHQASTKEEIGFLIPQEQEQQQQQQQQQQLALTPASNRNYDYKHGFGSMEELGEEKTQLPDALNRPNVRTEVPQKEEQYPLDAASLARELASRWLKGYAFPASVT